MMNLVNKEVLSDYIYAYNGGDGFGMGVNSFLENWADAKDRRLFKLMGGELILEKEIKIEKSTELLERETRSLIRNFADKVWNYIFDKYSWGTEDQLNLRVAHSLVFDMDALITNKIESPYKQKIGTKTLAISKGQKTMKAIATLLKTIEYPDMDKFEEFRLEHSRALNDKVLKGTMCLSIHPMDYITVSDNESGWESCLSWMNEGCYRAGTLELVNCPRTVVAYLKSSSDMFITGTANTWNSKRWRQLIIADERAIISNKAYPYASDEMTKIALDWVKELAEKNCGDKYLDETVPYDDDRAVCVETNKVYNDLDGNGANGQMYLGYSAIVHNPNKPYYWGADNRITMGGEAYCLQCGSSFDNENSLHCSECRGENWCEYCDEYHYGEEYTTANGEQVCEYCYEHYFFTCEECGDIHQEDSREVDEETGCYLCGNCYDNIVQEREDREDAKEGILAIEPVS